MSRSYDRNTHTFNVLDEPCRENGYVWTISVVINGFVGVGKHTLKRNAIMLADKNARDQQKFPTAEKIGNGSAEISPSQDAASGESIDVPVDPFAKRRRLLGIMNDLAEERGKRAEDRVFDIFSRRPADAPPWFLGLKRPTPEQDWCQKIDVVVMTEDAGDLFIQVKSSWNGFWRFLDDHPPPDVRCIVVNAGFSDESIRNVVYKAAAHLRQAKLGKK